MITARKARQIGLAAYFASLITGCDDRPTQWDAFIYPDDDLIEFEKIKGFKTYELCQQAAQERLRSLRPDGGGDYECGFKCEPYGQGTDMHVCKETR